MQTFVGRYSNIPGFWGVGILGILPGAAARLERSGVLE